MDLLQMDTMLVGKDVMTMSNVYAIVATEQSTGYPDLCGWTKSYTIACEYAKQFEKYGTVMLEFDDDSDMDSIFDDIRDKYGVCMTDDGCIERCTVDNPEFCKVQSYLLTDDQLRVLEGCDGGTAPIVAYEDELLDATAQILPLLTYVASPLKDGIMKCISYIMHKYYSRLIMYNHTLGLSDLEFEDALNFAESSGLVSSKRVRDTCGDGDFMIEESDVVDYYHLLLLCLRGYIE